MSDDPDREDRDAVVDTVVDRARAEGRTTLTEAEAKTVLAEVGIPVPSHRVAESVEDAVVAAADLGYPVVVKVAAPEVTHKSDWADGAGVALGLDSPEAVREAVSRILDALDREGIDGGVLVEEAVDVGTGTELVLGGTRHPSFGPTVLVGLGGVFAEAFEDVTHRLAPVSAATARGMFDEIRGRRLLEGFRGRPPADLDAAADAVARVGDLLVDVEAFEEVDVNPLLATADGVVALDALVVLSAAD